MDKSNCMFKKILALTGCCLLAGVAYCQTNVIKPTTPDPARKIDTVEASCGMCKFNMPGEDCSLAIRINGKAYYVDGNNIDAHGDAHAKDGFCNSIRKAELQGVLSGNIYKLTYFRLIPAKNDKK